MTLSTHSFFLLVLTPHTHRVHARHIGHPLLCDTTYGGGGVAAVNALARNKSSRYVCVGGVCGCVCLRLSFALNTAGTEQFHLYLTHRLTLARQIVSGLTRPALHARTLAFDHPASGKRLSFEADVPDDMRHTLQLLEDVGSWA